MKSVYCINQPVRYKVIKCETNLRMLVPHITVVKCLKVWLHENVHAPLALLLCTFGKRSWSTYHSQAHGADTDGLWENIVLQCLLPIARQCLAHTTIDHFHHLWQDEDKHSGKWKQLCGEDYAYFLAKGISPTPHPALALITTNSSDSLTKCFAYVYDWQQMYCYVWLTWILCVRVFQF